MSGDLLSRVRREIDARLHELRPAVREYERLRDAARQAAGAPTGDARPSERRSRAGSGRAAGSRGAGPRGETQLAIVAALEHGSHTVSELVVVTALPGARVRENLRRLTGAGIVARADRDGRAAYALSATRA